LDLDGSKGERDKVMIKNQNERRNGVRLKQIAASLALTTMLVLPAMAQSIQVRGNQRVDAETVRSYFSGERLDQAGVDRAVRAMYNSGQFSDVRVSRSGGNLVVSVRENSVVNSVTLNGNSKVKSDQLFSELQTKSRGAFSRAIVDADAERIREIYRRIGRSNAAVNVATEPAENGRINVTFNINEGAKTGIHSINFEGNQAYSAWRLKNIMQLTESNLLSFIKTSDVYDPDRLAADTDAIRRHYLKNGYIDARIVSSNAVYDEAKRGYVITIAIDEGEQYRVGNVAVESRLPTVDEGQLRRRVQTKQGSIYNAEAVEKTVEGMTIDAARRGQPFVQVRPRGDRDNANRVINLGYTADEGPRVYIERINVRGNTRTRDYVVRREFDVGEGDAFNRSMLDRAERRLKQLGYFKNVKISQEPGSSPDRVVVNVDVEDQPTGQFSIGAGYSTNDGVLGEVSVAEQNFLGRGQYVKLGVQYGQRSRGVDFSFTEPFFLGYRMSAGFDLFSKFTDSSRTAGYTSQTTGGAIRLGLPITDEFGVGIRYSLFQTNIKIPNTINQPFNDCTVPIPGVTPGTPGAFALDATNNCLSNGEASLAAKESQGKRLTSLVGLSFIYNSLDNPKNPTQGIFAELKPEVAGLGGDSRYVRVTGDARYYHSIADDVIGMLRAQGGHIQAFGKDKLLITDHFNPGPGLVRGFAPGGIGARDISYNPKTGSLGGTTYFGATAEITFPLFGLSKELGMRGAIFADAGTVFNYAGYSRFTAFNGKTVGVGTQGCAGGGTIAGVAPTFGQGNCFNVADQKVIRSSVGVGLLWQSPVGPIRFDYAFPLTKGKHDRVQNFRFSGGGTF
jgi:outer membrane protein insertion porin family